MSSTIVNIAGAYTTRNGHSGVWHELHSGTSGYAGVQATGSITFSRSSELDTTVTFSGTVGNACVGSSPYYGYDIGWAIIRGGTLNNVRNAADTVNIYISGSYEILSSGTLSRPNYGSASNAISGSFTSTTNEILRVCYYCNQSGGCSLGYDGLSGSSHSSYVVVGTLDTSNIPYNPYVPPVLPTYVALSTNSLKPDQSISVSWSGESPGTVGINHFQMEMSQWRGGTQIKSYVRVSGPIYYSTHGYNPCVWTTTLTSITDYDTGNAIQIRPGDTIQFHVVSYSGNGYTGWLGTVTATSTGATTGNANISVYKTGNIRYKNSSGTVVECTKGYYKDSGGTIRKLRYVKYKDSGGVTRIIDVYTTLYE